MKFPLSLCAWLLSAYAFTQGFAPVPIEWPVPDGGLIETVDGYSGFFQPRLAVGLGEPGSEAWETHDINGDSLPDLVVTAHINEYGTMTTFGTEADPSWKVYLNTGNGFDPNPLTWDLPPGGEHFLGEFNGYVVMDPDEVNSEVEIWHVKDMDGDGRPDLVVTGLRDPLHENEYVGFDALTDPHWKVYLNNGSGFTDVPVSWSLPSGGDVHYGVPIGFGLRRSPMLPEELAAQVWSTFDINGDARPDLVISGWMEADGFIRCFEPGSNSRWLVYLNTGNGFADVPVNWALPDGGDVYLGSNLGYWCATMNTSYPQVDEGLFNYTSHGAIPSYDLADLNGDGRLDFVLLADTNIGGFGVCFDLTSDPHWEVYLNTGTSFADTAARWSLPEGGATSMGIFTGYSSLEAAGVDEGSDKWHIRDLNADQLPDLVRTGAVQSINIPEAYDLGGAVHWKVHFNTGSGFEPVSLQWSMPAGGAVWNGNFLGFHDHWDDLAGIQTTPLNMWRTFDITGDGADDFVVTSEGGDPFSQNNSSYWKVYADPFSVGLMNEQLGSALLIYPNPCSGVFTLNTNVVPEQVAVFDTVGRCVSRSRPNSASSLIRLENAAPGTYTVIVTVANRTLSSRLIVLP